MSNVQTDPIAAQRQFLVSIAGIEGLFAGKSGGGESAETTDVYDGGRLTPDKVGSPARTENLTVNRPYRPGRDGALVRTLRGQAGRWRTTVTVQPTDADLVPIGDPEVFPEALLVGLTPPDFDAASGDGARVELVFAVGGAA